MLAVSGADACFWPWCASDNNIGDLGSGALLEALRTNSTLTTLNLAENNVPFFTSGNINRRLAANKRSAQYAARLSDTQPPSCFKVHLCGDGGAGKTSLSSALRRTLAGAVLKPWRASEADRPDEASARTRGIVVKYICFGGCSFSVWDYGGQPEFHLGHHDYMRGAVAEAAAAGGASPSVRSRTTLRCVAVFTIVVSLADERSKCAHDVLYWRRFIHACLPPDVQPLIALVGSRADGRRDAQRFVDELRQQANDVGGPSGLPAVAAAFAMDCRSRAACAPLRDWLVQQHRQLMKLAAPVPRACEAILERKKLWRTGKEQSLVLSWEDFCARCRAEIPGLAKADEELLRIAANFLHDSGDVVALDRGVAARCVVLHPTWLCSLVIGELLAPEWLHAHPERRRSLLSARELEQLSGCAAHFGEHAGRKLAELLCELGLCFRCVPDGVVSGATHAAAPSTSADCGEHGGDGEGVSAHAAGGSSDLYFFPTLLSESARPDGLLLDDSCAPHRLGRRLLARTADEVLVPGFMARLQVRAAEQPSFTATSDYQKRLWRDGVLLQHRGVQVRAKLEGYTGASRCLARASRVSSPLDVCRARRVPSADARARVLACGV
jgi:hypothetical protein